MSLISLTGIIFVLVGALECAGKDCSSPPAAGRCKGRMIQFYYDPKTKNCKTFNWGGCPVEGNGNRYNTKKECDRACLKPLTPDCSSEPAAGMCEALVKQFYYDPKTNTCTTFNWGGCPVEGNGNRYNTKEECDRACLKPLTPDCSSESASGTCKAAFIRFYYDTKTQTCKEFNYGGCPVEGNRNNYLTLDDCKENCVPKLIYG